MPRGWLLASFMPLVPGVALNASLLASGDALWAAPGIMVLASAARRRALAMLAWCGVALAVKQQAVCLAPFVRGVLLARRVPMRQWTAFPAGYLAMFVPASLAGAPLWGRGWHLRTSGWVLRPALVHAPTIWAIVQRIPAVATIAVTGLALAARVWIRQLEAPCFATAALPSPLLVVALLPRMHERYFFLAEVLALVWASGA